MRLIIAGSRDFSNYPILAKFIKDEFIKVYGIPTTVVSGKARGADTLGELWAKDNNIHVDEYPADWSIGRHAGIVRNMSMANNADALVAFWDGSSRGTKNMIDTATMKGLIVVVLNTTTTEIQHIKSRLDGVIME